MSLTDAVKAAAKEHIPLPVKGYTKQSDANVELVNEGKEIEERVLRYLEKVDDALDKEVAGLALHERRRYLALGRTNIQQGFMWAFRSVFGPQRTGLPEDTKPSSAASESPEGGE